MKNILRIGMVILLAGVWGCRERFTEVDLAPPAPPRGLYTSTGDNLVELFWMANTEYDLAGYNVYVGTSGSGAFELIGTTRGNHFIDYGAHNGITYCYTVSAFDFDGNESPLSTELVYETARPEGSVSVKNFRAYPDHAGYDFSSETIGPYDDKYTDIFFDNDHGAYYMDVWDDTDIQDMGYTKSIYEIGEAPDGGWSPTKDVRLIVGHTYMVWTWDNHFAKFRVSSLSPTIVLIDWAYQLQAGNPYLKRAVPEDRNPLKAGPGFERRK